MKISITFITVLLAAGLGHWMVMLFFKCADIKVSDPNGTGKWLGVLERALIALFVCLGLTSQTVFIFAVKAAIMGFRLPDDNKDERKKMAEHMLIGTMASYFIALSIGLLGLKVIKLWK